jgi:integrase
MAGQLAAFLEQASTHRLYAFFRLAAYTGARRGELLRPALGGTCTPPRSCSPAVPVHMVANRLGHADPSTTLRVYAHVLRDQAAGAADVFARAIEAAVSKSVGR